MNDRTIADHFRFCPKCGEKAVERHEGKPHSILCSSCSFTLYFNPNCSAAALIFDPQGKLLVIERAREPSKGKFGVPGGFTDPGERLEDVVRREVKEEVNLELSSARFFASFPNSYHYRDVIYPVIDAYFIAEADGFDGMTAEKAEVAGIQFVDLSTVPSDRWAFTSLQSAVQLYLQNGR